MCGLRVENQSKSQLCRPCWEILYHLHWKMDWKNTYWRERLVCFKRICCEWCRKTVCSEQFLNFYPNSCREHDVTYIWLLVPSINYWFPAGSISLLLVLCWIRRTLVVHCISMRALINVITVESIKYR